ncbi:hypothetical protein L1887_17075 [Cichorium endivia]|nr:hypothetical protein L1887_17075 [Cichorium endivia]
MIILVSVCLKSVASSRLFISIISMARAKASTQLDDLDCNRSEEADLLKEVICSLQWTRTARKMAVKKILSRFTMVPTKIILDMPSLHM